jgi:hypothetical protein
MRMHLALITVLCLVPAVSRAQTATGTGVGISQSNSAAGAVAISGQGGRGGKGGNSNSSLTVNSPAATTSTVNGTTNLNTTGMQTLKSVPNAYSPGLSAAGLETCLGSISGGGSAVGWGASFGTTIPDPGCNARLDARTLWSMGLKAAAIARLCQSVDIYHSMPDICYRYAPQQQGAQPIVLSTNPIGQIELIDGKTGLTRMCDNYDAARYRCLAWTGERPHRRMASKKSAAIVAAVPAAPVAAEPAKEN